MRDLLTIVPSRGRPGNARELVNAFIATAGGTSTDLMFVLDGDDPEYLEYHRIELPPGVSLLTVGPRAEGIGGMPYALNIAAENYWMAYRYLGFMGDDHRPRTPLWDLRYIEALDALQVGVVYGDDTIHGAAIPTQCAMNSAIPRALGYFCPPGFRHLYLDNVWKLWGESIGRLKYLPNVTIEHLHPVAGKAEWDARYRAVNAPAVTEHDHAAWRRYSETFHDGDGRILRDLVRGLGPLA